MTESQTFANALAVLSYLQNEGRKIEKTKLYEDIRAGRLRRQPDKSFRLKDVKRYALFLPLAGTPDKLADEAEKRMSERDAQETRRIRAIADKEEFNLQVRKGEYIKRDLVYRELAMRAVALTSGLKTFFESRAMELVAEVEGNPKKIRSLIRMLEGGLDAAMNEYAQLDSIELIFDTAPQPGNEDEDE